MSLPVSTRFANTTAASASAVSLNTNFEEFASGLETSGYLNSTMASQERPVVTRENRRKLRGRVRGQGETPDWIRQLFGFAKKGNLERLVREQLTVYITISCHRRLVTVRSGYSWKYLFRCENIMMWPRSWSLGRIQRSVMRE